MNNQTINIKLLSGEYSMHKLDPSGSIPTELLQLENVTITRNQDELSITCPSHLHLASLESSAEWKCFQVVGILDFDLVGIIAKLSELFAKANIPIYVVSTYNTDYIYIQRSYIKKAEEVLSDSPIVSYYKPN